MTDNKHMTTNKKQEQDGQTKNKPQTTNKGTKNTRTIAKVKKQDQRARPRTMDTNFKTQKQGTHNKHNNKEYKINTIENLKNNEEIIGTLSKIK